MRVETIRDEPSTFPVFGRDAIPFFGRVPPAQRVFFNGRLTSRIIPVVIRWDVRRREAYHGASPRVSFAVSACLLLGAFPGLYFRVLEERVRRRNSDRVEEVSVRVTIVAEIRRDAIRNFTRFHHSFAPNDDHYFVSRCVHSTNDHLWTMGPITIIGRRYLPNVPRNFSLFLRDQTFYPNVQPGPISWRTPLTPPTGRRIILKFYFRGVRPTLGDEGTL